MAFIKITESESHYHHLDKMSVKELLTNINKEDQTVPGIVAEQIPAIEALVTSLVDTMLVGGRLFYIGAGTSGRLGIVDASECPPTYGVEPTLIQGIIAGGIKAVTQAVEGAEDSKQLAQIDLEKIDLKKSSSIGSRGSLFAASSS